MADRGWSADAGFLHGAGVLRRLPHASGCRRTCCRRSATISERTLTNASTSRGASSSIRTGPAAGASGSQRLIQGRRGRTYSRSMRRPRSRTGSEKIISKVENNGEQHESGLNIRQDGALDFLSLGALVHRLDPGHHSVPQSNASARSTSAAASSTAPPTCPTASG